MYYGFIVYSHRDTPAVIRHCIISGEYEQDTVMNRQQVCANYSNGHSRKDRHYTPADIRIRSVTTIPTSLLDTVRAAMLVVPCDKMPAAIGVLAALAAHES